MTEIGTLEKLRVTVLAEDSVLYESPYLGQHGISLLLEGTSSEATNNILVDVGQNSNALLYNMERMGISLSRINSIVLTHCHYDHTQELTRVIREIKSRDVRVYAHSDIFRLHFITEPYQRHVGIMPGNYQTDIEKAGGVLHLSTRPEVIMHGIVTTGEIKRRTRFEKVNIPVKTVTEGTVVSDMMLDDISVVANVKGRGLVVVAGCSHAGIINIITQAMDITGCTKLSGIIGGLHLITASENIIRRTIKEMMQFDIDFISAGHCTGFEAQKELSNSFGKRFSPLHTGMTFDFGNMK